MDITTETARIAEVAPYAINVSDDKSVAYLTRFGVELARFELNYWDGRHTATLTELPLISHSPNAVSGGSSTIEGAIVNSLDLLIYAVNNLAMMFAKD